MCVRALVCDILMSDSHAWTVLLFSPVVMYGCLSVPSFSIHLLLRFMCYLHVVMKKLLQ